MSVNQDSNGNRIVTVSYNDGSPFVTCLNGQCVEHDNHIHYTSGPSGTRYVQKSATMLGWSYSLNDGQTWTKKGPIAPPSGWAVLWGDPGISTCPPPGCSDVFITNLGISNASFDAHSVNDPTYGPSLIGSLVGIVDGGCIARSTDGGKTFAVQQCVTNAGDFYDGSAVSVGAPGGPIFAAWVDTDTSLIDVWRSAAPGQPFVRIASPPLTADVHPRIRANGNQLYVATQAGTDSSIRMSYWNGSTWSSPVFFAYGEIYPNIGFSNHAVRAGPQFAFDYAYYTQETGGPGSCSVYTDCCNALGTCLARCVNQQCKWEDQVRVAYTYRDAQQRFKIGVRSSGTDLAFVHDVPEWGTAAQAGDQYNPVVGAFRGQLFLAGADWHVAYQSRASNPSGNTVTLEHSRIALFANTNIPFAQSRCNCL